MSWIDEPLAILDLPEDTLRQDAVRKFLETLRANAGEADKALLKTFAGLRASYKAGLFHDAKDRTLELLRRFPDHPLLLLLLAHCCLAAKDLDAAASKMFRAEAVGAPDEIMLEMKARYCAAENDQTRSSKLKSELNHMIETRDRVEHETRLTHNATHALTWAWCGALGGFCLALVGVGGLLLRRSGLDSFFFGFLLIFGLAALVGGALWIRRSQKVLDELKVYESSV